MCFMGRWSEERVISAAPDPSSLTAARKLAHPGPWSDTGSNDVLVWGKMPRQRKDSLPSEH